MIDELIKQAFKEAVKEAIEPFIIEVRELRSIIDRQNKNSIHYI